MGGNAHCPNQRMPMLPSPICLLWFQLLSNRSLVSLTRLKEITSVDTAAEMCVCVFWLSKSECLVPITPNLLHILLLSSYQCSPTRFFVFQSAPTCQKAPHLARMQALTLPAIKMPSLALDTPFMGVRVANSILHISLHVLLL